MMTSLHPAPEARRHILHDRHRHDRRPFVDGAPGTPALFDATSDGVEQTVSARNIVPKGTEAFEGGVVWLRYEVTP
ncbi:MAG: hypothetical protein M3O50_05435 [Myxococcota bacterium]|nr:hypothetical protein [Myxococcota bacterium]